MNSILKPIKWRYILTAIIIMLGVIAGVLVRVRGVEQFQDQYLSGYDSYFYYRQAKTIIAEGGLPERDYMQNYPDGLDLRGRANLNCYAIAYLYKITQIFVPDISVETVAIYYPVILFILILITLFGLTKLLFGESVSLIVVTIFATIPAAVDRTHAGWADRDALSLLAWLVCIYFYAKAYQGHTQEKRYIPFALLSGISMGALGLTWPGVGLLSIIIVTFNAAKLLTRSYDKKKFCIYLCWFIPSLLMMLLFTERYSLNQHRAYTLAGMALPTLFTIVVPTLFTIVASVTFLIKKVKARWIRIGSFILLVTSLVVLLFVITSPQQLIETFLRPAGKGSFTSTVGEFNKPVLFNWFYDYQLFFIFPLLGVLLVTYSVAKAYQVSVKVVIEIFIITLAVTVISAHPDIRHRLMEFVYLGCIILMIGTIGVSYFYNSFKKRIQISLKTDLSLFFLIWAVLTLIYAQSAFRFTLFLSPPAVILGAYGIIFLLKRVVGNENRRITNLTILMCFLIFLWQLRPPLVALFNNIGLDRAMSSLIYVNLMLIGVAILLFRGNREFFGAMKRRMGKKAVCLTLSIVVCLIVGGIPYYSTNWISWSWAANIPSRNDIKVYDWLRTNTPTQSVVAAWWGPGSRIEAIAERATIVDQQHNIPRIQSIAREVFCAQTPEEALRFLKNHKATHLMITSQDIYGSLGTIVTVGLSEDSAKHLSMDTFVMSEETIDSEDTPQEKPTPQNSFQTAENAVSSEYKKELYLRCSTDDEVNNYTSVEYKADGSYHGTDISIEGKKISPKYFINGSIKHKHNEGSGSLVLTNVDVHHPYHIIEDKHAVYFNEEVCNLLTFQLFYLGLHTEHFKQVYPTQEMILEDSTQSDYTKIWKINY